MPPRLRPSQLPSTSNVIPQALSTSPLLPFLLPSYHIYITLPARLPPSSRQFSTSKPLEARGRGPRFEKTPGRRNGFINWLKTHAPRLNNPAPLYHVPVYLSYEPRRLPIKKGEELGPSKEGGKDPHHSKIDWEKAGQEKNIIPFPTNPTYKVHPVISTEYREQIYQRIKAGRSVRRVSAELNCELERVAAVARLKEIENMWNAENRPLCTTMQTRIHAMMPVSQYKPPVPKHESITDMRIHAATNNQLFLSVPESSAFNRKSAGEALGILPADFRMPHSELIDVEKMRLKAMPFEEMKAVEEEREAREAEMLKAKRERREERLRAGTVVETERFRFRMRPAVTGQVGFRYGAPHEDRKRGVVKIPKRVL
ncbi:hypothetical protein ABW19_dt0204744 [Dactylella cylindrospora]|nr:hypothetical protein ABW19_dt0204744 [Dactylella cylindrospora]